MVTVQKKSVFEFRDITFTVKVKKMGPCAAGKRELIKNISGCIESGHVLAILGPSGAGKSTLINALSLGAVGGTAQGHVTLDGRSLDYEMLRRRCFVVGQEDFHWAFLSCKETLDYAAALYLPSSAEDQHEQVRTIITKMGLESCKSTRVGNEFIPGLSGGQRRRLSLAVAFIKKPDVIFLDEPTSGLDAASATKIMSFIKESAVDDNLIFITTIHQPSSSVYNSFDQVMILSQGREAYVGEAKKSIEWFAQQGFPIPPNTNPADHCLDLVNVDFLPPTPRHTPQEQLAMLLDAWQQSTEWKHAMGSKHESNTADSARAKYRASFLQQIIVMLRRHSWIAIRDPTLYLGRCVVMILSDSFFAIIYIKTRERAQDQVVNKMFLNIWFIGVPCSLAVIAVYAYNAEFKAIRREMKNGMVSPMAYVFASSLMQLPFMFLFAAFALLVPAYCIGKFYIDHMPMMVVLYAVSMYAWEGFAQLLSIPFDNPLIGMMAFIGGWFTGFLFSGWMLPTEDVMWPFRIFAYILPLRYTIRGMVYLEFMDTMFEPCLGEEPRCYGTGAVPTGHQSGSDVLDSLGGVFRSVISSENTLFTDILMPLALAVTFKLLHAVWLCIKAKQASTITPHTKLSTLNADPTPAIGQVDGQPVVQERVQEEQVAQEEQQPRSASQLNAGASSQPHEAAVPGEREVLRELPAESDHPFPEDVRRGSRDQPSGPVVSHETIPLGLIRL